jgi:hypothetical protein
MFDAIELAYPLLLPAPVLMMCQSLALTTAGQGFFSAAPSRRTFGGQRLCYVWERIWSLDFMMLLRGVTVSRKEEMRFALPRKRRCEVVR